MIKFLHISDVHLGCRRYNLEERTRDFFRAWYDVVKRHAVANRVDFVLIAGDFFDRRNIDPQTMNHAIAGLQELKDASIPVVVIEGNHDRRDSVSPYSWMRSFSQAGLLMLLEPAKGEEGETPIALAPWDEERREGSYVDIAGARIFGTHWYGTTTGVAVSILSDALREARDPGLFHILMLHTDVEGQLNRPIPALPVEKLKELRALIDYVALGHTHKRFEIDNWAFNPGSLEACTIDEAREERGVYLVEVDDDKQIKATHLKDYFQRPFQRITFDVSGLAEADEVRSGVLEKLKLEARGRDRGEGKGDGNGDGKRAGDGGREDAPAPIIEVSLRGHLGFKNSLLELGRLRDEAREQTGALHVLVKNQSVPVEYAVAAGLDPDATRAERERRIVADLIGRNNRWRDRAEEMAELVLQAKKLALGDEPPDEILKHIEEQLGRFNSADAPPKTRAVAAVAAADEPEEAAPSPGALHAIERNAAVGGQLSAVSDD